MGAQDTLQPHGKSHCPGTVGVCLHCPLRQKCPLMPAPSPWGGVCSLLKAQRCAFLPVPLLPRQGNSLPPGGSHQQKSVLSLKGTGTSCLVPPGEASACLPCGESSRAALVLSSFSTVPSDLTGLPLEGPRPWSPTEPCPIPALMEYG